MGKNKWYEKNLGDTLPLTYKDSGHPMSGFILILIGIFFGILMGWGLIEEMLDNGFEANQLGMLVIILPGLAAFITGLFLFYKIELNIDSCSVKYSKRRLFFKNTKWSEELSEYDGILMEENQYFNRKSSGPSSTGQFYITRDLILKHRNNKKHNVVLYTSRNDVGFRQQSEKFARLLNKPILQNAGESEFSVREVDHLDKKAAELVREGKMEVKYDENRASEFPNLKVK